MAHPKTWLPDRYVGANMSPWRFVATDDRTGDPRDWTKDRDGNSDQHSATFTLKDWAGTTIIDAEAFDTLGTDGEMLFNATLADVSDPTVTEGNYVVIVEVENNAGDLVDVYVFGQKFVGVP